MKLIWLNNKASAIVDDDDYDWMSRFHWREYKSSKNLYSYAIADIDGHIINMHRLIMNAPVHMEVDHIDMNGLNNQRNNLRLCTSTQNRGNLKKYLSSHGQPTTSKYKGVIWRKDSHKWRARIRFENKLINLGHFINEIDAARAYDKKAIELFGEFARLNNV